MTKDSISLDDILQQKEQSSQQIIEINESRVKLVIFSLAAEHYAFYGHNISEILPENTPVFFVPGCPQSLPGVINLRGAIESVIDIGMILKLSHQTATKTILLGVGADMRSGICVNTVIDVVDVLESDIQSPPDTLPEPIRPYVLGVLKFADRAVTLLNLEQIFGDYQQGLA